MTNADRFKAIFGLHATELWAKPEKEFLKWLNADVPDTNVGDMISRQAVIEAMRKAKDKSELHRMLAQLTSAQPERKGKWVGYDGDWLKTMCKCSKCGAMIDINEKYRNFFCYHCGARMDGEQDE